LDVLFNNAVARAGGDLRHMSAGQWDLSMKVNSTGLFLACQIFSEPMQAQRSGSIVNIASIYGMAGPDFSIYAGVDMSNPVNYAFSKGGMNNLPPYLASSLPPYKAPRHCLPPSARSMSWLPAGISIIAADLSAITIMATPAWNYKHNLELVWAAFGYPLMAPLVIFVFVPFYSKLNLYTAYEYLERRFSLNVRL